METKQTEQKEETVSNSEKPIVNTEQKEEQKQVVISNFDKSIVNTEQKEETKQTENGKLNEKDNESDKNVKLVDPMPEKKAPENPIESILNFVKEKKNTQKL